MNIIVWYSEIGSSVLCPLHIPSASDTLFGSGGLKAFTDMIEQNIVGEHGRAVKVHSAELLLVDIPCPCGMSRGNSHHGK